MFVIAVTAQHEHHHGVAPPSQHITRQHGPLQLPKIQSHGRDGHIHNAIPNYNHEGHQHKQWHGHEIKYEQGHEHGHEQAHKQELGYEHWHTNSLGHRVRHNYLHKQEEPSHFFQQVLKRDGHPDVVTVHSRHGHEKQVDYHMHPKYEVEYKVVDDHHAGDHRMHHEHSDDVAVKGLYSLHKPDGSVKDVHYHSDKKTGFPATVKLSTHNIMPEH